MEDLMALSRGILFLNDDRGAHPGGEHGQECQRHGQRTSQRKTDHIGELFKHDAGHTAHKNKR